VPDHRDKEARGRGHFRRRREEQLAPAEGQALFKKLIARRGLILAFRLVLAATFLASSMGKLVNIREYSVLLVIRFDLLPLPLATAFGWALPFIELSSALGLFLGVLTRLSALSVAMLSASFFVVKAITLSRGIDIDCGCFGAFASTMASWSIYLDPIILLLALAVLLSPPSSRHWVSLGRRLSGRWSDRLNRIW
jgi:uncharacterized membrane protein YphA (DoxX/SURF4 family)